MTLTVKRWALVGTSWLSGPRFFSAFHTVFHTRDEARAHARTLRVSDSRGNRIPLKPVRVRITMSTEERAK